MKISSLATAPKVPSGLNANKMYTSPTLDVIHMHLAAGEKVAVHVNPVDVVFCVISGNVIMDANGEQFSLSAFDVVEVLGGTERGLRNESDQDVRVLVLKKMA